MLVVVLIISKKNESTIYNNDIGYDFIQFKRKRYKKHNKHNNEIKYNFKQKVNFTKNILSTDYNNFIKNFDEIEQLNNNIIDIDENEYLNSNNNDKITKIDNTIFIILFIV